MLEYSPALLPALSSDAGCEADSSGLKVVLAQLPSLRLEATACVINLDYQWQEPYVAAVLETDRSKLSQRIDEARSAIQKRIHDLNQDHMGTLEERAAIEFALNCLKVLHREIAAPKPQS